MPTSHAVLIGSPSHVCRRVCAMEHACAIAAASYTSRSSWRPRCGCAVSACKTTFSGDVTKKSSQLKEAEAASSQSGVQPNTTAAASPLKGQIGTSPITPAAAVVSTASDTTAPATASVTQSEVAAEASTTKARTEATVSEPAPPESVPNVTAVASLTKISARSSLIERFSPWLSELRQQLKEIAEDMVRRIGAGERGDDEEDDDGSCGGEKDSMSAEEVVSRTRELAFRLGSLLKLLMEEVLPRMPDDAEVLFLIGPRSRTHTRALFFAHSHPRARVPWGNLEGSHRQHAKTEGARMLVRKLVHSQ
eukprot:6190842-Pleurochrysis_carterae.AAC.1